MMIWTTHQRYQLLTGAVDKHPSKESLTDAFRCAASAIADVFTPRADRPIASTPPCSPNKIANIRMNIEQLRSLQCLHENGILTEKSKSGLFCTLWTTLCRV